MNQNNEKNGKILRGKLKKEIIEVREKFAQLKHQISTKIKKLEKKKVVDNLKIRQG